MHIERIHKMQECLTEKAVNEFEKGVENVDTSEMGEVVDMIKDLAEAEYHSIISKAMKKADEEEEEHDKELLKALKAEYGEEGGRRFYDDMGKLTGMRDMDRGLGRMYFTEPVSGTAPSDMRMPESEYDRAKRHYTETREMHTANTPDDKEHKMKALDGYIKELGGDITQLIGDMTAEEKNLLRSKMSTLVSKI